MPELALPEDLQWAILGLDSAKHRKSRKLAGAQGEGDHMEKHMADAKSEVR